MSQPITEVTDRPGPARQAVALLAFLVSSYGAAALGSVATGQSVDGWYRRLEKPPGTPPGGFIGAVWTLLYGLMALSGWLVWRAGQGGPGRPGGVRAALRWYAVQLGLNIGWSYAFFWARSTTAGLAVIVPLWLAVLGWARAAGRVRPLAGWLQAPYLLWVSFASYLNADIWWRN